MKIKQIFIVGLRRSGTTVFWKSLRADPYFQCFDEPFNPKLRLVPHEHAKGTWTEFNSLFREAPGEFHARFAPIGSSAELSTEFTAQQLSYLKWLCEQGEFTVCDFTRCHFKVASLANQFPNSLLVHLIRSPVAVASSHLLPSERGRYLPALRHWLRKSTFFTRRRGYNRWQFEEVVRLLGTSNIVDRDPEVAAIIRGNRPAFEKLLAYWKLVSEFVEREGRRTFGNRFMTVNYEAFIDNPKSQLEEIYNKIGREAPKQEFADLHSANKGYKPSDSRWAAPLERCKSDARDR